MDKVVYLSHSQYVYKVVLQVPGKTKTHSVDFYTTRKAFDALTIGDIVKLTYSLDSDKHLSIIGVSKV